jgi:hypothetical protein
MHRNIARAYDRRTRSPLFGGCPISHRLFDSSLFELTRHLRCHEVSLNKCKALWRRSGLT